jgi:hypothetical protein
MTLDCGIRVCDCPLFANLDEAPWHRRRHGKAMLDACAEAVHGACVPSLITEAKWQTMCGRLVVCLVGHPFEWQDRPGGGDPICVTGIANPIIRKIPTCDRFGEPLPAWRGFTRLLLRGCFVAGGNPNPTDAEVEAKRDLIKAALQAEVEARQAALDLHDYTIEWCHRNCQVEAVTDWLAANPPPPGWTGYTVDVGPPGGPSNVLPMQWAFENRQVFGAPGP